MKATGQAHMTQKLGVKRERTLRATPMTDKLIDDMLHGNGIPRCDEWDKLVRHAKALETSFYRVNRELDDALTAARKKERK